MNTVLRIGVLLLFALALVGSAWYTAFRLRTTFGLQRRWLLRGLVVADHRGPLQVFVSQGGGTYMSRVRLGTSNELNILRLKPTR